MVVMDLEVRELLRMIYFVLGGGGDIMIDGSDGLEFRSNC